MLKPNQLQSLLARNSADIASVHRDIQSTAAMLKHVSYEESFTEVGNGLYRKVSMDDYNRPFYAILSKLQSKRKQLEALQRTLKRELKSAQRIVRGASALSKLGIDNIMVTDLSNLTYIP